MAHPAGLETATLGLEDRLDMIASGKADYAAMMRDSDEFLDNEVKGFLNATNPQCPDCGKRLIHRVRKETDGKKAYDFCGYSGYPDCEASFKNAGGPPGECLAKASLSEHTCSVCGKALIHRIKEGEGGYDFWACSGYPDCKATFKNVNGQPGEKK